MDALTIGVLGAGALVALAVLGVRIAYAAALVGTLGLMILMDNPYAAIVAAGTVPYAKGTGYELLMEPGRSIVGNAGVLLTRIEYLKVDKAKRFQSMDDLRVALERFA